MWCPITHILRYRIRTVYQNGNRQHTFNWCGSTGLRDCNLSTNFNNRGIKKKHNYKAPVLIAFWSMTIYSDTPNRWDNKLHHDAVTELVLLSNLTFYRITGSSDRNKNKYEGENVRHVWIFTRHIRCNQCNHMTLL